MSNITLGLDSSVTRNERHRNVLNEHVNTENAGSRSKRNTPGKNLIEEKDCTDDIKRLCGTLPVNSDDLFVLECIQSFKVSAV
jgi:hypothetical protein